MKPIPEYVLKRKEKFLSYLKVAENGCWIWQRYKNHAGYGRFMSHRAHRVSFTMFKGDPTGFVVCHHCDNPPCVNPDHLFLGTVKDNVSDMMAKGRKSQQNNVKGLSANNCLMTEDMLTGICDFYSKNNVSVAFVARKFGMPISRCCRWLKRSGIKIRNSC